MSNASKFGKVAVLLGGKSAEREVSLDSGAAVLEALVRSGVNAEAFDPKERSVTELVGYDRAFVVLHGRGGEDGQIQGVLEWLNIPYTGTGVQGSAIGMDKVKTKQVWQGSDLPTAPYRIISQESDLTEVVANLGLPLRATQCGNILLICCHLHRWIPQMRRHTQHTTSQRHHTFDLTGITS